MAGTALYEVGALHTYQRALENDGIRAALQESHLYIVSRRPRTTVTVARAGLGRPRLVTRTRDVRSAQDIVLSTDAVQDPTSRSDDAYWSGIVNGAPVHGEAWHLAALLSDRATSISAHEVLYVGQAYGTAGSRHTGHRTSSHSTLQKIYEDHRAREWDVFVTPLVVGKLLSLNDDHIDDAIGGLEGGLLESILQHERNTVAENTVDVVEHLLISYFRPKYNKKLLDWVDAKHLAPLRNGGYRLVSVQLQALHELAAFFSATRTSPHRSHRILAEVPALPEGTEFTIGGWDEVDLPEISGIALLAAATATTSELARSSSGILRVFGDSGPVSQPDFSAWGA